MAHDRDYRDRRDMGDYSRGDRDWRDAAEGGFRHGSGEDDGRWNRGQGRGNAMAGPAWRDDSPGGRPAGWSGYGPYAAGRNNDDAWRGTYGHGGVQGDDRPGMTGQGMGMSSYPPSLGMERSREGYGWRDAATWRNDRDSWRDGDDDRGFFERAGDEIASWFGDEDAQRRREMDAGHRGRGPRNYTRSDERIREDVSDRLLDDHHLDASDIEVTVSGGEVTLDGTVDSRAAKRHAEDLADDCSGVTHVQNNLRVRDRRTDMARAGTADTDTVL